MRKITSLCGFILMLNCMTVSASTDRDELLSVPAGYAWPSDSAFSEAKSNYTNWWEVINDPLLDSLITIGEANNYDASAALRRINISRSQLRQSKSAYFPQIDLSASYNRNRMSGRTDSSHGMAETISYFNAEATLSWEIDIFGKISRRVKRAGENVKVSATEYKGVILALDAQIAETYINLLVEKSQLEVAQEHSENQWKIVHITEERHRTGLASKLDVAQAKTLYYSTIATIPMLEASIEASYNALAVLTGTMPGELPASIYKASQIPTNSDLTGIITIGSLVYNRPDLIEAERNVSLAAAELGISRSEWLPSLTVTASAGTQAHNMKDMFSGPSFTYSVMPTLSWTLFDGLSRTSATAAAKEQLQVCIDNYNATLLTAIEEVRNSMSRYRSALKYIERIESVIENCQDEVRLSIDLYKQGLTVFSNVVDAQLNYLTYRNTLLSAKGQALSSIIELYKAIGGTANN